MLSLCWWRGWDCSREGRLQDQGGSEIPRIGIDHGEKRIWGPTGLKIWGKGVGLYQDCREMGIMDGSVMLISSRKAAGKGHSPASGTPWGHGAAQMRTPGDAQMKGSTDSLSYLSVTEPPSVQVLSASSPSLRSFSALPVWNRNTLPRKLLGEVSPLCTSPAWKHHMNAKCSADTEQHCSVQQDLSSHVPWPFQTNLAIQIKNPHVLSLGTSDTPPSHLQSPLPWSHCKGSFKPTFYSVLQTLAAEGLWSQWHEKLQALEKLVCGERTPC